MPAISESCFQLKLYCSTGVWALVDHVRTRVGRSESPESFTKTMVRLWAAAFFFSVGQRLFFHRAMAFSSRCSARFSGRWQLQPIAAKRRETWLVLYEN